MKKVLVAASLIALISTSGHGMNLLPPEFNPADLKEIYSEDWVDLKDGTALPLSKTPLAEVYRWNQAPERLRQQWGKFQFLSETKGYIHLGEEPDLDRWAELFYLFADIPSYQSIEKEDGTPLFSALLPIDARGRRLSSFPPFPSQVETSTRFARATVPVEHIRLSVDLQVDITPTADGFEVDIYNFVPVRYGILGQVIPTKGLFVRLHFYAYQYGWLAYGVTKFDMANFLAGFIKDPWELASYGASITDWIAGETVHPLQK